MPLCAVYGPVERLKLVLALKPFEFDSEGFTEFKVGATHETGGRVRNQYLSATRGCSDSGSFSDRDSYVVIVGLEDVASVQTHPNAHLGVR